MTLTTRRILGLLFSAAVLAAPARAAVSWEKDLASAQKKAHEKGRRIFVDFTAVWCYSCYYMDENVLSTEQFRKASEDLVLLKVDVDTEEGRALKEKYKVAFLPSFLLLRADGAESGRISGEQTPDAFMEKLAGLKGHPGDPLLDRLASMLSSGNLAQAERYRDFSAKNRTDLLGNERWLALSARLDLHKAVEAKDAEAAAKALDALFQSEKTCDLAYDVLKGGELVKASLPKERLKQVLTAQRRALMPILDTGVFGKADERCADRRSPLQAMAATLEDLGLAKDRAALLDGAVAALKKEGGKEPVGKDRNRDDDLRWTLDLAGKDAELEALYPKLIAAYPSDYVYAYRFARYLQEKGRFEPALAQARKAKEKCYGANCLSVAYVEAQALSGLKRGGEAADLLDKEIKGAGRRFPKDAERLKELLAKLRPAKP